MKIYKSLNRDFSADYTNNTINTFIASMPPCSANMYVIKSFMSHNIQYAMFCPQ